MSADNAVYIIRDTERREWHVKEAGFSGESSHDAAFWRSGDTFDSYHEAYDAAMKLHDSISIGEYGVLGIEI